MSRIGKKEITIPEKVEITITESAEDGQTIKVKGPLGEMTRVFRKEIKVVKEDKTINLVRNNESKLSRSLHGLTRSLLANMIEGVTQGFKKELEIHGVGYRAKLAGVNLDFQLGKSHPVVIVPPAGIKFEVQDQTNVVVSGYDKELVGQIAANIISLRPPEPYKGKGIRIKGQKIRRKAGKSGGKA